MDFYSSDELEYLYFNIILNTLIIRLSKLHSLSQIYFGNPFVHR